MSFINKDNLNKSNRRNRFKTLIKIDENCLSLPWLSVNSRKRHIKWAYIRAETHNLTAVETSKKYAFTYKIPR